MMKCELKGRNFEIDDKLQAYIVDKIGGLEKYLPRQVRETASCSIMMEDDPSGREDNRYVCEAVLSVHGTQLVSREGTVNAFAAVDIVEAKLRSQMTKYKDKYTLEPRRGRMLGRLLGRRPEPEESTEADSDGSVVN
jgi:putative sigma-54 modulation protein